MAMTTRPIPDGPEKPAFGAPCNGCGLCCVATPCRLALDFVPGAEWGKPCPALEWADGRSWCGLVRNPVRHSPLLALVSLAQGLAGISGEIVETLGGVGGGCDSGPRHGPDRYAGFTAREFALMDRE